PWMPTGSSPRWISRCWCATALPWPGDDPRFPSQWMSLRRDLSGALCDLDEREGTLMRIVFAPDSFKGTITAADAAQVLADAWLDVDPAAEVVLRPMADGGEGTVAAFAAAVPGDRKSTRLNSSHVKISYAVFCLKK